MTENEVAGIIVDACFSASLRGQAPFHEEVVALRRGGLPKTLFIEDALGGILSCLPFENSGSRLDPGSKTDPEGTYFIT